MAKIDRQHQEKKKLRSIKRNEKKFIWNNARSTLFYCEKKKWISLVELWNIGNLAIFFSLLNRYVYSVIVQPRKFCKASFPQNRANLFHFEWFKQYSYANHYFQFSLVSHFFFRYQCLSSIWNEDKKKIKNEKTVWKSEEEP